MCSFLLSLIFYEILIFYVFFYKYIKTHRALIFYDLPLFFFFFLIIREVDTYHRIAIRQKILQLIQKSLVLD